jgi:hypothetical protein
MSKNSRVQGDFTVSSGFESSGTLFTDFIQETTNESGVTLNSNVKTENLIIFTDQTSFTTELSFASGNFTLLNNSTGNVNLFSKGGKGISINETTGNVLITSTADSLNTSSGSLITAGGAVIGKTLNVVENINALDGIHSFTNSIFDQNVIDVKNTSNSGKSSIFFKDSFDVSKLEIGYGNLLSSSPYTGASYIQGIGNTELLFRTNNTDSFKILTSGDVLFQKDTASTSTFSGSVVFSGGISISNVTDATTVTNGGSLTTAGGISVAKNLFVGKGVFISEFQQLQSINSPVAPDSGIKFYVDQSDSLYKSKDLSGNITTYQPTTTKGDITVHDGTTQVRLPAGQNGYALVSNSSTSTGLEWVLNVNSISIKPLFFNFITNIKTIVIENPVGSFMFFIYPQIENGASCLFFCSKSIVTSAGVSIRLNLNRSLINNGVINLTYPSYKGVNIDKSYTEANGNYVGILNEKFTKLTVILSGNTWTNLGISDLTGCFCFSTSSNSGGPAATFFVCKNVATLNNGNITRIVSAQSLSGASLQLRYQNNSFIQIRKTNSNDDGEYNIIDNFQDTSVSTQVLLSGTNKSTISLSIFNYYENKSFMVKVTSQIPGAPFAIFTTSKNSPDKNGNSARYGSPGQTTNENLNIFWDTNLTLQLSKSGNNYDGLYDLVFTALA